MGLSVVCNKQITPRDTLMCMLLVPGGERAGADEERYEGWVIALENLLNYLQGISMCLCTSFSLGIKTVTCERSGTNCCIHKLLAID